MWKILVIECKWCLGKRLLIDCNCTPFWFYMLSNGVNPLTPRWGNIIYCSFHGFLFVLLFAQLVTINSPATLTSSFLFILTFSLTLHSRVEWNFHSILASSRPSVFVYSCTGNTYYLCTALFQRRSLPLQI